MNEETMKQFRKNVDARISSRYSDYLSKKIGLDSSHEYGKIRHNGLRYKIAGLRDKPFVREKLSPDEIKQIREKLSRINADRVIEDESFGEFILLRDPYNKNDKWGVYGCMCRAFDRNGNGLTDWHHYAFMKLLKSTLYFDSGGYCYYFYGTPEDLKRGYLQGNIISDFNEEYGIFRVGIKHTYKIASRDGKEILPLVIYTGNVKEPFSTVHEGYSRVNCEGSVDYIDMNGNFLLGKWEEKIIGPHGDEENALVLSEKTPYEEGGDFNEGYARVKKNGKWTLIDYEGKEVLKESYDEMSDIHLGRAKVKKGNKSSYIYPGMGDYKVKRTLLHYECSNGIDTYRLSYQPVKRMDSRYTLCTDKKKYYLYDSVTRNYINAGDVDKVAYDEHLLYDDETNTVYYISEQGIIDISDYYEEKMMDKREICYKKIEGRIISSDEFFFMNEDDRAKIIEEEKEKLLKQKEDIENEKRLEEIKRREEEQKAHDEQRREKRKAHFKALREALVGLEDTYDEKDKEEPRMVIPLKLIKVGDHLEIAPEFIGVLKYIDLAVTDFTGVKLSGIDFSGTNFDHVDPQVVYNRDLSGCNFEGVHFTPASATSYEGVNIKGCKFTSDDDPKTMDRPPEFLADAEYDETTTYNGKPLYEVLDVRKK